MTCQWFRSTFAVGVVYIHCFVAGALKSLFLQSLIALHWLVNQKQLMLLLQNVAIFVIVKADRTMEENVDGYFSKRPLTIHQQQNGIYASDPDFDIQLCFCKFKKYYELNFIGGSGQLKVK